MGWEVGADIMGSGRGVTVGWGEAHIWEEVRTEEDGNRTMGCRAQSVEADIWVVVGGAEGDTMRWEEVATGAHRVGLKQIIEKRFI